MGNSLKLIFFDIDGTIWNFKNEIPESTVKAIRLARKNGHLCFLNSGRTRGFITHPDLLNIGFDGIVAGCGTTIEYHDEIIFSEYLTPEAIEEFINVSRKFGFKTIYEGFDSLYLDHDEWPDEDMYYKKIKKDMGNRLLSIKEHWGKWEKISKMASDISGVDMKPVVDMFAGTYDFLFHNEAVVEIVPKGYGKSKGMEILCDKLGVSMEDTFAFGDSVNDLDMIQAAGCGIVMGNATDNVKQVADYVTKSMFEDGIYFAMEHFNLI